MNQFAYFSAGLEETKQSIKDGKNIAGTLVLFRNVSSDDLSRQELPQELLQKVQESLDYLSENMKILIGHISQELGNEPPEESGGWDPLGGNPTGGPAPKDPRPKSGPNLREI